LTIAKDLYKEKNIAKEDKESESQWIRRQVVFGNGNGKIGHTLIGSQELTRIGP
jgi:hypothetical protein